MKILAVILGFAPAIALAWSYPRKIAGGSGEIAIGTDSAGNQVLQISGSMASTLFKGMNSSLGSPARQGRDIRCVRDLCEIQIDSRSGKLSVPGNDDECLSMDKAPMTSANFYKTKMGPQRAELGTRDGKHVVLFEGALAKSLFGKMDRSKDRKVDGRVKTDELENLHGETERSGRNMRCIGGVSEPFCEFAIDLKTGSISNPKTGDTCPAPKAATPATTPSGATSLQK